MSSAPVVALGLAVMGFSVPTPAVDSPAVALADRVHQALGGDRLEASPYLAFTFAVDVDGKRRAAFHHDWDRRDNRYRVEGATEEGNLLVLFDLDTRQGNAWIDGKPVPDEDQAKWLEFAYERFINDTYWLLVPFKLRDPGVNQASEGEAREGSQAFDRLGLSFDENVGLTPGDRYTLWVDRASSRVDRWEMLLQGKQPPPVRVDWRDWVQARACVKAAT